MSDHSPLSRQSAKLKKAIVWMAQILQDQPEKSRQLIVEEAELRFDLTPLECNFLDKHFAVTEA